jgi:hypothetical protein
VPIISILLKDLYFTNDGNPKYLLQPAQEDKSLRLINIEKMLIISKMVLDFCRNQKQRLLPVDINPNAKHVVTHMKALKEQALYKYSCLCEPKTGDGEVNLREKWMHDS